MRTGPTAAREPGGRPRAALSAASTRRNAAVGQTVLVDSAGCLVVSADPQHLVAAIGCEDLIVVHTADATLVCRKERAEEIKELYKQLPSQLQ